MGRGQAGANSTANRYNFVSCLLIDLALLVVLAAVRITACCCHETSHFALCQGRVVIDKFIERDLWRLLSPLGVCLLLLLDVNSPEQVKRLIERHGMFCKTIISRIAGGEKLLVMDIRRHAHTDS